MRQIILLTLIFIGWGALAQNNADNRFGKPVVWYTIYDPWAMFIGSDGPVIAIYETGKVIFWKNREYRLTDIGKDGVDEIMKQLKLRDTFFRQSKYVDASYNTHQPSYVLALNEDTIKYFSVYRSMRIREDRKNIPRQLLNVYTGRQVSKMIIR